MVESVASLARAIVRLERRAGMAIPRESVPRLYIVAVKPVRDVSGKLIGCSERAVALDGESADGSAGFLPGR
jgi:hypothetical protein